jgi:hypothetical protein
MPFWRLTRIYETNIEMDYKKRDCEDADGEILAKDQGSLTGSCVLSSESSRPKKGGEYLDQFRAYYHLNEGPS